MPLHRYGYDPPFRFSRGRRGRTKDPVVQPAANHAPSFMNKRYDEVADAIAVEVGCAYHD